MIRQTQNYTQTRYENFGEMRTLGVEAEVKADVLPWLYGYANVTFQDLRDVREYEPDSKAPNPTRHLRMPNIPYFPGQRRTGVSPRKPLRHEAHQHAALCRRLLRGGILLRL